MLSKFDKFFYLIFFIILMFLFIKISLGLLIVLLLSGFLRTWQIQNDPRNKIFLSGVAPNPKPEGLYNGSAGYKVSWLGKKFNPEDSTGINVFDDKKGGEVEKYPFKTSIGKGLADKNLDVLKIDYNIKNNPFWLRFILDEIVQVAPDKYLGKAHIRIIPGFTFSVLYFELKK